MTIRKAMIWAGFWISLALIFNAGVFYFEGKEKALMFFGGYVMEQSMSIDNLFVFLMIFTSFKLNEHCQRRALNYGIIGAIVLRLVFILLGASIVNRFEWALYIMGAFLIYSGLKVFKKEDENSGRDYSESRLFKTIGKIIPMSENFEGDRFFVRKNKVLYATPLLAIVAIIEMSDILFAVDSVPAILSITTDTFIVYFSNIFAILGLRNFYFLLEKLNKACRFVKYGVGVILLFVGIKLVILLFHVEISTVISVSVIFSILLASVIASLAIKEKPKFEYIFHTALESDEIEVERTVNE